MRIQVITSAGLAIGLAALVGLPAMAQTPSETEKDEHILYESKPEHDIFKFDYGAPSSPAMTLLGLTPDKTPPSTSLTEFVVSLPTLLGDEQGQSLALDAPVARLFGKAPDLTFDDYTAEGKWLTRLGYRTRAGLALLNGSDGGSDPTKAVNSRVSLGVSASVLDSADPLMAEGRFLQRCLREVRLTTLPVIQALSAAHSPEKQAILDKIDQVSEELEGPLSPERRRAAEAEFKALEAAKDALNGTAGKATRKQLETAGVPKRVDRCVDRASRMARFASDLDVGFGLLAEGDPGKLENFDWRGGAVWIAFKHPVYVADVVRGREFDDAGDAILPSAALMVLASGRAGWDETVASGDAVTPKFRADTFDAWVGVEWLTPAYRLSAQYGWLEVETREAVGKPFERSGERYLISAQVQLGSKSPLWLGASYGNGYGTVGDLDSHTALITLSYAPGKTSIAGLD